MASVVLVVLAATRVLPTERALAVAVVLLAAVVLRELLRTLNRGDEPASRVDRALRRRGKATPAAAAFAGMEREIALAVASASHAHRRLTPLLRSAAAARLASHHGIVLERRPDLARQLLGEPAWELVRPDGPPPPNRRAAGPKREAIAAAVAAIEAL